MLSGNQNPVLTVLIPLPHWPEPGVPRVWEEDTCVPAVLPAGVAPCQFSYDSLFSSLGQI